MADISVMNVGGTDYNIKDSTSRTNSTKAMSLPAYYETGNTASQAYSVVGTPINWKGTLYYTKTTVAKGATWTVGTNLTAATNLGKLVRNIKTYVGSDSKLHFVDLTGADTALNFSVGDRAKSGVISMNSNTSYTIDCGFKPSKVYIVEELMSNALIHVVFYDSSFSNSTYTALSVYNPNNTGSIRVANLGSVTIETTKLTLTSTGFIFNSPQSISSGSPAYYVAVE